MLKYIHPLGKFSRCVCIKVREKKKLISGVCKGFIEVMNDILSGSVRSDPWGSNSKKRVFNIDINNNNNNFSFVECSKYFNTDDC